MESYLEGNTSTLRAPLNKEEDDLLNSTSSSAWLYGSDYAMNTLSVGSHIAVHADLLRFQYVNLVVRFLMGITAASTNLFTLIAIVHYEYMRSCTNYLIAVLAAADMVAGFSAIYHIFNYLISMSDRLWARMCAIEHTVSVVTSGMNIMAILGIAFDRLAFITFPLHYHQIVTNRRISIFLSIGALIVLTSIVPLHCCGYNMNPERICTSKTYRLPTGMTHVFVEFFILTLFIVIIYGRIAYVAHRQAKAIQRGLIVELDSKQRKITKMLSLVLGVYLLSYAPDLLVFLAFAGIQELPIYFVYLDRVTSWFWWINSWSNPPIYAWKNKDFNKAFRCLLGLPSADVHPATLDGPHDGQGPIAGSYVPCVPGNIMGYSLNDNTVQQPKNKYTKPLDTYPL